MDLPQGGFDVLCRLTFNGEPEDIDKVQKLLEQAPKETPEEPLSKKVKLDTTKTPVNDTHQESTVDHQSSSVTVELIINQDEEPWVGSKDGTGVCLSMLDKTILINGESLTDKHIATTASPVSWY